MHLSQMRLQPVKWAKKTKGRFFATCSHFIHVQHLKVLPSTPVHSRNTPEIWENMNEHRGCNITSISSSRPESKQEGTGIRMGSREQGLAEVKAARVLGVLVNN